MKSRGAEASFVLGICASLFSCARAEWRDADANLSAAAKDARAAGFLPMAGPHNTFGSFTASGTQTWTTRLDPGKDYFVAAACTAGCAVLEFSIEGPRGESVGTDTTTGPTPRLEFVTAAAGAHGVTITWGECTSADPCRWVLQVYEKKGTP